MNITDQAKVVINEALTSNQCDYLRVSQQSGCCGPATFRFEIAKRTGKEQVSTINGVPVVMDDLVQASMAHVTISVEDGELTVKNEKSSCCT